MFIILLILGVAIKVKAQAVVVNADGTHSPVIQTGNTVVAINTDGTHSVGMVTGNMITVVDPQSRHSVGFVHYNPNASVNSDGTLFNYLGSSVRFQKAMQ